jgi:hypothetical protein
VGFELNAPSSLVKVKKPMSFRVVGRKDCNARLGWFSSKKKGKRKRTSGECSAYVHNAELKARLSECIRKLNPKIMEVVNGFSPMVPKFQ